MRKRINFIRFWIVCLALVAYDECVGQQYPVFSQYYFNEMVINPAYVGSHVQLSLNSTYRNQWVNFPGAPKTFSFSGHTSLLRGKIGVGLLFNNDQIGSYNNQNIFGFYSYRIHLAKGTLSMGLQAGLNLLAADFSKLNLVNPDDPSFYSSKGFKPNFGAGLYYSQKDFFIGFSVPFILNNVISGGLENTVDKIREARYYFLRGGAIFPITADEKVKFNPSILVRAQEGQPLSMDLNAGFVFHDAVSTGASWRSGDAFIWFVDFKLSEKFHFAYSYDFTSSPLRQYSNGSHEFMINYRAKITRGHQKIPCPTYYHYGTLQTTNLKKSQRFNLKKR
jgi:type IX secretion system PorP/SprF family membrane protein